MNLFFVFNPKAGKEKIKQKLGDIIELFSNNGHTVTVHATTCQGDACEKVKNLPDGVYDRIIVAGGDGTLDEVVHGMLQRENKIPVGYIPAGSTNDYASSLGIPSRISESAKIAINDHIFASDVGTFGEKSFVYVAAFGAFTEASYATSHEMKKKLGYSAYIVAGIKSLGSIRSYKVKVTTDSLTVEDSFIYGMVTNSVSVGGFKGIVGKQVQLDDGLFEVTLVRKPKNPNEMNSIISGLLNKEHKTDMIYSFTTDKIKFESEESISWTLDGEFGGEEKEVEIINRKNEFEIAVK